MLDMNLTAKRKLSRPICFRWSESLPPSDLLTRVYLLGRRLPCKD